jgi:hypothetical protein
MTVPPEILALIEQSTQELDRIEQQANEGLVSTRQLLERFPNNVRLISLSANLGNVLFFVDSFRNRIENMVQNLSGTTATSEAIQAAGEELSEFWGRILECRMSVNKSVSILEDLQ